MLAATERTDAFKQCTVCGKVWPDIRDMVLDPELQVDGYQACFTDPQLGLILLTHRAPDCGNTLALVIKTLRVLYAGPVYSERQTGLEPCRDYCLRRNILEECDAECELAWARTVLQYFRRHELPLHMIG